MKVAAVAPLIDSSVQEDLRRAAQALRRGSASLQGVGGRGS